MILKSETESLLNRMTEGTKHRKEVKKCRTIHSCANSDYCCRIINIGEPAIVITSEVTNPHTQKTIYITKYYHVVCEPK